MFNKKTIELRFFQGTLDYRTILSYLEFAYALSMFVKKTESTNAVDFIQFTIDNNFKNLTDLLNGKIKRNDGTSIDKDAK